MTDKTEPVTDEELIALERMAVDLDGALYSTLLLRAVARIRQEERRAEAAERVMEAFRGRRPYSSRGEVMIADTSAMMDAMAEYDFAKAAGFAKEE